MRAVLYRGFGGTEVLEYVTVADPEPGPRDVIVRVNAAALNRLDLVQRSGWYQLPGFALPHIAGTDVCGVVAAVGSAVESVTVGTRVVIDPSLSGAPEGSKLAGRDDLYGDLGIIGGTVDGGYAELCLVPDTHVYVVPDHIDDLAAAVFPTAWLTAWHAMITVGRLQAGETVMIHAAGSGVSVAAIQIAHWRGARVLATAGGPVKVEHALAMGVAGACDNRADDVTAFARAATEGRGVDMVLDHVGPALFAPSLFSLRPRGRMIVCGNTSGDQATIPSLGHLFHSGISIIGSDPYGYEEFAQAWAVYCELAPTPVVAGQYALADLAAAQDQMASGEFFGKLVVRP